MALELHFHLNESFQTVIHVSKTNHECIKTHSCKYFLITKSFQHNHHQNAQYLT